MAVMVSKKRALGIIFFLLLNWCFTIRGQKYKAIKEDNEISNKTFVVFDPKVSILDKSDLLRYNSTEQVPIVAHVANKFTRLFIQLSEVDLNENLQTSLAKSAMAVAEYNKQSGSFKKLQVWLSYNSNTPDNRYHDDFIHHKQPIFVLNCLVNIAKESNAIFNGTVTTILFPYNLLNSNTHSLVADNKSLNYQFPDELQWGLLLDTSVYTNAHFQKDLAMLRPNVVIIVVPQLRNLGQFETDIWYDVEECHKIANATNHLTNVGLLLTTYDTDLSGNADMSNLISIWHAANNLAIFNGTFVVLSKTFDIPSADVVERKTSGWWRLVENPNYNTTTDYIFEEKMSILKDNNYPNETSLIKLQESINFSGNYVEIIFSLFDRKRENTLQKFTTLEESSILKHVPVKFKKLVLLMHDDSLFSQQVFIYELNCLRYIAEPVEISLVVLPGIDPIRVLKMDLLSLNYIKTFFPQHLKVVSSIKSFLMPFDGNGTLFNLKKTFFEGVNTTEYKLGYTFNITTCNTKTITPDLATVGHILRKHDVTAIMFFFEETEATVKLGTSRMFKQRVMTMEQCRKLVVKWNLSAQIKLSFMMLHYATTPEFYTNKREMITFIEYWQKLSDWANEKSTAIVLSNVIDVHRHFKTTGEYKTELGWWRLQETPASKESKDIWINKIDDAITRFPGAGAAVKDDSTLNYMNSTQIILTAVFVAVVALLVVITVIFTIRRKNYIHGRLVTKEEIYRFFKGEEMQRGETGGENTHYCHLPYEKQKFEISRDDFTVDLEHAPLGSGEFGRVCLGSVQLPNGEQFKVAIKMINPKNIEKNTVKGFMSEIKVLSYVGEHDHVIKMFGANTQDLKFGKVFILLELCARGSLEKNLRKLNPTTEMDGQCQYESTCLDGRTSKYLQMVSMKKKPLDICVAEDLLRWSYEICRGMAFLASKRVVHADLATRNVLVDQFGVAKICDFGLSRRMYNYNKYVKQQQEPLPWKWMAPESLKRSEFSEKSDVWAYGITLWEIFNFGDEPFQGLAWSLSFADMLEAGFRLGEPKYDDKNLYLVMKECWSTKPENRPTFQDLLEIFDG